MKVTLKSITPNPELLVVEVARASSKREDKTAEADRLINYLIRNKHWSPFEHSFMTVEIVTSKAIGIQLLRHRSFFFQEFSQRYAVVENIEDIEIREQAMTNRQSSSNVFNPNLDPELTPACLCNDDWKELKAGDLIQNCIAVTQDLYQALLAAGVAKECARMILPMAAQTTIFMTGNLRSWIHFIQLRDDPHAQKEAQLIAREIKRIFVEQCPNISKALTWNG